MLSFMARDYFGANELLLMPLIAFILFIGIFALVTVRALRADRQDIELMAGLPLADDVVGVSSADENRRAR